MQLTGLPRKGDTTAQKSKPLAGACHRSAPQPPLLQVLSQRIKWLFLFRLLFAHYLGCPSIKQRILWVEMHEKLKCVITYSPFEPFPSLRVICFLTLPGDRGALFISFINLHPTQTSPCSGRLSKLKYQTFVWQCFLTYYHTKDYENWKKQGDMWGVELGGEKNCTGRGKRIFLIGKCSDKIKKLMKWESSRSVQYLKIL